MKKIKVWCDICDGGHETFERRLIPSIGFRDLCIDCPNCKNRGYTEMVVTDELLKVYTEFKQKEQSRLLEGMGVESLPDWG